MLSLRYITPSWLHLRATCSSCCCSGACMAGTWVMGTRAEAVAPPVDAVSAHLIQLCEAMQESEALDSAPVDEDRCAAATSGSAQVAAIESDLGLTVAAELGSETGADAAGAQEPPISADSQGSRQLWDPGGDNWASNVCTLF